jgi:hypothetical protein
MADDLSSDYADLTPDQLDAHFDVVYIKMLGFKDFLLALAAELLDNGCYKEQSEIDSTLVNLLRRAFDVFDTRTASGECLICVAAREREDKREYRWDNGVSKKTYCEALESSRPKELSHFLRKLDSYDMGAINGKEGLADFIKALLYNDLEHDYPYYINKHGEGIMSHMDSAVVKLMRKAVNLHETIAAKCSAKCSTCGKW